jgi:undecaprenyl-diphosphatase
VPLFAVATVGLWLLSRPGDDRRWKLASASALAAAAVAMLANQLISHLWERPRPFTAHPLATHLLAPMSTDPSFPSDHAAVAFAIAFAVLAFSRRAGAAFLVGATAIAASRVVVGVHYPTDVLAGALVGWTAALVVTRWGAPALAPLVRLVERVTDPVVGLARRQHAQR